MLRNKAQYTILFLAMTIMAGLLLAGPSGVKAGIYNSSKQVTYKEYWVDHKQFTGGCNDDGSPTNPNGSWYVEPGGINYKCPKTLSFSLPDDFSNAVKVEMYLDLWRAYDSRGLRYKLNNGTVNSVPVGWDWSRTPWVAEVDMTELNQGNNTITFTALRPTHIHDIGFRIYYTNENPLLPGPGSDVEPPTGQLTSIKDDGAAVGPDAGGTLTVNGDKLTLTADFSADTKYIEFHAWYEGYDEDNDGEFRDWHNLGRNNWWPGGFEPKDTGGVINHIGTIKPKADVTTATITWDIPHVTNQPVIKFKIRVVDAAGNVREAAGGESAEFKLMRTAPVNAFIIHDFTDFGLHMDAKRPDEVSYDFRMPASVATYFTNAFLVGAYWRNPYFSINGSNPSYANPNPPDDHWKLGVKTFNKSYLVPNLNRITYSYSGSGPGNFVERPGPMFVLRRSTGGADNTPPVVSNQAPLPNAVNVDTKSPLVAHVGDSEFGVDWTTVRLTVNDQNVTDKAKLQGTMGEYRLVYKPAGNFAFNTEYNVKIEACDMVGNCMSPVTYKFTTAAPDTNPPVISNIVVVPLANGANITWNTNEPATSRVDYGKTKNYELGFKEDNVLKTSHSAEIRGLQPQTLYNFQIKGMDEQGNTGQSGNQTFTTTELGEIVSDDFNYCQLNPMWTEVDPKNDTTVMLSGETITLTTPAGSAHDWTAGGPPRFMQVANDGDFAVEIEFESAITAVGQIQGILIEEDANNYVRIGFEQHATKGPILFARFVANGTSVKDVTREYLPLGMTSTPPLLKVTRTGDTWTWYWKASEADTKWTRSNPDYVFDMSALKIGFYGGNSGAAAPGHSATVDYFFNSDTPIVPEDAAPMNINVTTVGTGTVTKIPDQTRYLCGDLVTLSATTIPGWSFDSWSGDATGTAPTTSVTMDGGKNITATFTEDQYLLNVVFSPENADEAGNVVTKSPDQPTYVYDDVVQLTADPAPGWKFIAWSGAITSPLPTASITMRKDETVTATFEQEKYSLILNVTNNGIPGASGGSTTISPLKATYVYGDEVTLTATVNPGWTFGGWSGGTTSSQLTTTFTITGNTVVNVTFNQIQYTIDTDVISLGKEGVGGQIVLNPNNPTYVYNQQVVLAAQANACWTFTRWEGDVTGTEATKMITITDNVNVTAVFTQNKHTLTVNPVGPGQVTRSPNLSEYYCGDEITLTATPAQNYFFSGWSGDLTGGENPLTFAIEKNMAVTATFSDNPPPTVDPIPDKAVIINQPVTFQVKAADPRGEKVTLKAEGLPAGAKFTDNGNGVGTFSWTPSVSQMGEYSIIFIATDPLGHQGSQTVILTVSGKAIVLPFVIR